MIFAQRPTQASPALPRRPLERLGVGVALLRGLRLELGDLPLVFLPQLHLVHRIRVRIT